MITLALLLIALFLLLCWWELRAIRRYLVPPKGEGLTWHMPTPEWPGREWL